MIAAAIFMSSCQSQEQKDEEFVKSVIEKRKIDKEYEGNTIKTKLNPILDSLNKVYNDKGVVDFCVLKADLDSIFLTADYMAQILLDGKSGGSDFEKLRSKIEKDRAAAYFKKNRLNRKQVNNDNMLLAMEYPLPCEEYVNSRYAAVKEYLRTKHSAQLYREAFIKYK